MGQQSSKDEKILKKSSRDIRLFVLDDSNNMHTVVAPKPLLVEHSRLFKEMVENGTLKKLKKLKLEGVTVIGVLKTLQYIENGSVTFETVHEVSETIKVAEKYKIDGIEEVCLQHLNENINASNACDIYELAVDEDHPDLIYKCLRMIDEEADNVLRSESFLHLKQSSVIDIVKRNSLNVESEFNIFQACLKWGKAEMRRLGQNWDDVYNLKQLLRLLLLNVRFKNMSPEEQADPAINDFIDVLAPNQKDPKHKYLPGDVNQDSRSMVSINSQPRFYLDHYVHGLEIFDSNQSSINNGENFNLKAEVLKGKVFLCGVNLALKQLSSRMNATCLHAALTATNERTKEQKRARGTFLDIANETSLMFCSPLFLKDGDTADISIHVKMAGNVCPLARKNDVEIVVPVAKDIAMKILPLDSPNKNVRCIFKDVIYFY